jgi:DNA processing protein
MEKFLHAFNLIPEISYGILHKFWRYFEDWQKAWQQADEIFFVKARLSQTFCENFLHARKNIDVDREFEKLERAKITAISQGSREYPSLLREIPFPPFLLYRKGAPLNLHQQCFAIVGTRLPSSYGANIAYQLAERLSLEHATTVSGLALGIDAKVHWAAVQHQKPTIAVLASSLFQITPPSHRQLAESILKYGGTLLSEYALDSPFHKHRYVARNRIISGLSLATFIIEARFRSGALITARHALEQNRSIYALPGDITRPQAQGCLQLIAQGANLILSIQDVLQELGFQSTAKQFPNLNDHEKRILTELQKNPCSSETLFHCTGIAIPKLNGLLSSLEMKNAIYRNQRMEWCYFAN